MLAGKLCCFTAKSTDYQRLHCHRQLWNTLNCEEEEEEEEEEKEEVNEEEEKEEEEKEENEEE